MVVRLKEICNSRYCILEGVRAVNVSISKEVQVQSTIPCLDLLRNRSTLTGNDFMVYFSICGWICECYIN